jgi:putative phosphoserine phosphatase / 1-acylglycerol-3-phosphate O-acyltransferase
MASTTGGAAIFDLDRTLISGPSGPVFARRLHDVGHGRNDLPGMSTFYRMYELAGENLLTMQAARLFARTNKGWSVDAVAEAADAAADDLLEALQPYASDLFEEQRAAGRRLVMATTSPAPLVSPFAAALGFDGVVATRWSSQDGKYNGSLDGPFVWGRAKLEQVKEWAAAEGADLKASSAYSDSYYDAPLLAGVGEPVAVNPDARLAALANLRGWPVRYLDLPPGVMKIAGRELQEWMRPMQRLAFLPNARIDVDGTEHIPKHGPVIVVFNHRSYFDGMVLSMALARSNRSFRFLGKKEVFDAPVIGMFTRMMGGIRVERGTGSDEPLEKAIAALRAGEAIYLAPEGTIPRGPAFFEPELKGRWGAARLAHATHAPVIPVGIWGTEKVWPRNSRLPRVDPRSRPPITVRVGPPVELAYDDPDADTKRIMSAISDQLPPESRIRRDPTPAELAATYPPGYRGDPSKETDRRPGTNT